MKFYVYSDFPELIIFLEIIKMYGREHTPHSATGHGGINLILAHTY
jgi:hypothetical protein